MRSVWLNASVQPAIRKGITCMSEYTEAQIIKHALEYYMVRPNATAEDIKKEVNLLKKYVAKVKKLKKRLGIV